MSDPLDALASGAGVPIGTAGLPTSYVYPWFAMFQTNLATIKALAGHVPAKLEPARAAIEKAGATIAATLAAGNSVSSDDAKNWLALSSKFAAHLPASPVQQSLATTAAAGDATPDDSLVQPVMPGGAIANAIDSAARSVENIFAQVPWGWVGLGAAALILGPMILSELTYSPPARRRRA